MFNSKKYGKGAFRNSINKTAQLSQAEQCTQLGLQCCKTVTVNESHSSNYLPILRMSSIVHKIYQDIA